MPIAPHYQYFLILASVGVLSLVFTRLMIGLAPKLGLIDQPDARRIHVKPIPRAGGIAVYVSMLAGLAALNFSGLKFDGRLGGDWLAYFLCASGLLVLVGVIDDRRGMSAWVKLGAQVTASVIMFFYRDLEGFSVWTIFDLVIHVGWHVALINAFNLIDGMDGLCAGLGMIALAILGILAATTGTIQNAAVIFVMWMALAGFLRYNFHPARIFLGDTGSMLIGFFVASAGASTVGRHAALAGILLPLLVAGVPLFDVFLAIWRRSARRIASTRYGKAAIRIFDPDRDHLHHRLLGWGLSQRQVAMVMYGFAVVISILALIPILGGADLLSISLVGLVIIGLVGLRYIAPIEFVESGWGLRAIIRRPRGIRTMSTAYFLWDVLALTLGAFVAWMLVEKALVLEHSWDERFYHVMVFTSCAMFGLRFGRAHVRRWTRASIHDFIQCGIWLLCGVGISVTIQGITQEDFSFRNLVFHLCALALGGCLVFLPRCVGLAVVESVVDSTHRSGRARPGQAAPPCLLYGAGDLGELFVHNLRLSPPDAWMDYHFVGFLDDNRGLMNRRLGGFRILGGLSHLPEIVRKTGAKAIMVTCSTLSGHALSDLERHASELNLEIHFWTPNLRPEKGSLERSSEESLYQSRVATQSEPAMSFESPNQVTLS